MLHNYLRNASSSLQGDAQLTDFSQFSSHSTHLTPHTTHIAPHVQVPGFGISLLCLSPRFQVEVQSVGLSPQVQLQCQLLGVVFPLCHRYCSRHVIQCKYGLCSARRTSQAGAALMNESYCCHFGLVFDTKLSLILETWGF